MSAPVTEIEQIVAILQDHAFEEGSIREDLISRLGYDGPLLDIFLSGGARVVHKWHHYLPLYERYFSRWRGKPLRFLEIGVDKGGSLELWRRYFGLDAVIYGIDINPDCAAFDGKGASVRIGSQDDPAFLNHVVDEMGGVDVVLDDGSHHMNHIRTSLDVLFPRLQMGGTYMIEDLHAAYWKPFGGGDQAPTNFFSTLRHLIDDMHRWYTLRELKRPVLGGQVGGVHIHDSVVVLDKAPVHRPVHSRVGGEFGARE